MLKWWNGYTQKFQKLPPMVCGFESRLEHHKTLTAIKWTVNPSLMLRRFESCPPHHYMAEVGKWLNPTEPKNKV